MIFFGKGKRQKIKFSIKFVKYQQLVAWEMVDEETRSNVYIPSYCLIFGFGKFRYWVGHNRLKRIIRDKVYSLDGRKIVYKKGRDGYLK